MLFLLRELILLCLGLAVLAVWISALMPPLL